MADDTGKTYSENEHLAILADRVATETASITAQRDQLKLQFDEAQAKLDAADSAKIAAEQAKETAEKSLTEFKAEVEEREEAGKRKDKRMAYVKEKAAHLNDEWFNEDRIGRIVAMKDEDFESYVTDLVSAVPADGEGSREVPRETAMAGQTVGGEKKSSAASAFLLRDYQTQEV